MTKKNSENENQIKNSQAPDILLRIHNLSLSVKEKGVDLPILKGIDMEIPCGSIVGLVGESGCGKSMTAKTINGLLPDSAQVTGGEILWYGNASSPADLTKLKDSELKNYRGRDITMVFQEPMTSLNPLMRVGDQVREVLMLHHLSKSKEEAKDMTVRMLGEVGLSDPEHLYKAWPHELSGGMRQRVVIAMAGISSPKLIIADEPTTALDVTTEAQILKLIKNMCETSAMSVLLITHNMRVIAQICDYVYVMYMGRIVEAAPTKRLLYHAAHPYTRGLLSSIPKIGENKGYLNAIPGENAEIKKPAAGCEFCLRCSDDIRECFFEKPDLYEVEYGHFSRCHVRV